MRLILSLFFLLTLSLPALGFELVVIQGLSKEKQTFITRNDLREKRNYKIFPGKKATFTADNVTIIAKALKVSKEFIQWEIENNFTDVPFRRGDIVTMYDATEYLWALTPEKIKRNYINNTLYKPRRSIEAHFGFTRGLSESVSEAAPQNVDRGGYQFEGSFRQEFNLTYSIAYGIRYSKDVLNLPEASLINQRFIGIIEGRYYFEPLEDFYNAKVSLGLGFGFGQSRTVNNGTVTFGNAALVPSTKLGVLFPINKTYDFEMYGAFESFRLDETDAGGVDQTTNMTQSLLGVLIRKHL